jgi:hypothetical protein
MIARLCGRQTFRQPLAAQVNTSTRTQRFSYTYARFRSARLARVTRM